MPDGGATISVTWGYERRSIALSGSEWQAVEAGQPFRLEGHGYRYEGESFQDHWLFNTVEPGSLIVGYGDEGAVGFDGFLHDATIELN